MGFTLDDEDDKKQEAADQATMPLADRALFKSRTVTLTGEINDKIAQRRRLSSETSTQPPQRDQ